MRELLLLLCKYPYDEANRDSLSNLLSNVSDWHALVRIINAHGITALASYNIKEAGLFKIVPEEILTTLDNGYMQNIVRNAWLTERWKEVNELLCEAGIKHILLKGLALEHTIYGSRGLRQMNDTDILIEKEASVRAWKLLKQKGFSTEPFKSPLFKYIRTEINQHLPTLYKNGYALEIHDNLFPGNPSVNNGTPDPFKDPVEIIIAGAKVLCLQSDLQLVYLAGHFERHALEGDCQLRLYTDIHLLNRKSKVDIPDVFIFDPIQSHKIDFRKAAYKANIKLMPKWQRALYILGDTFPSLEWMKKRYNCNWQKLLLYYPLRLGKLLWLI